jgi:hypothetical protein
MIGTEAAMISAYFSSRVENSAERPMAAALAARGDEFERQDHALRPEYQERRTGADRKVF